MLLCRKADLVYKRFNAIPGVSCRRVSGAMYAFPKIELPPRTFEEAKVYSTTFYTLMLNPFDAMDICLNKRKIMHKVLAPSTITPYEFLWT